LPDAAVFANAIAFRGLSKIIQRKATWSRFELNLIIGIRRNIRIVSGQKF
jgi:hypothetical protein